MERHRLVCILGSLIFMIGFGALASAQTSGTGALTGTVTDPSGYAVPGVTVTLTDKGTTKVRTAVTGATGIYRFSLLPPGDYEVQFSATGFSTSHVSSVIVNVTEVPVIDEKLQVGSQSQEITVTNSQPITETQSSTIGTLVDHQEMTAVPLTTRNFTQVISLSPGVTSDVNNAANLGKGSQDLFVNGSNQMMNTYSIDGNGANNWQTGLIGQSSSYGGIAIPNPDAIEEFKVQTSLYDAGYGRGAGANVNLVTRGGTNSFHGEVFEFFRNTALNANDYFLKRQGSPRGVLNQNQFGATFGGPVLKKRLLFFVSYQGTRQINGVSSNGSSSAILPYGLTDTNRTAAGLGEIFCGQTGAFGTTKIACDGSNINPVAVAILQYKLPNGSFYIPSPSPSAGPSTVTRFTDPATFREDQGLFNIDYLISQNNTLTERLFYGNDPDILSVQQANGLPGSPAIETFGNANGIIKLTSTLSPTVLNEARWGLAAFLSERNTGDPLKPAEVGIQPLNPNYNVMPTITVAGFSGSPAEFEAGGGGADGTIQNIWAYQWGDQVSLSRGKHFIRIGYDGDRQSWYSSYYGGNRGALTFENFPDFLLGGNSASNGTAGPGGNGIGNIYAWSAQYSVIPPGNYNEFKGNDSALFVQDDFKVRSGLTLNLGLRWEYFGSVYDELGHLTGVNLSIASTLPLASIPASGVGSFVGFTEPSNYLTNPTSPPLPTGVVLRQGRSEYGGNAPLNNFGPRIGFAWQPLSNGNLVVRGGYGWFYALVDANSQITPGKIAQPINSSVNLQKTNASLATLQNPFIEPGGSRLSPGWTLGRTLVSALSNTFVPPSLQTQFVQAFNLNLQQQFSRNWALEIGYVGTRGTHLLSSQPINQPALASASSPINCGLSSGCVSSSTITNTNLRVPYVGWSPTGLSEIGSAGSSFFNSLQVLLRSIAFHGLQMQAAYTYGKTMTNVNTPNQDTSGLSTTGSLINFNNPLNKQGQWGPASFDRTNRVIIAYNYQLPGYHNPSGFIGKATNGWSVAGVTTVQGGMAISVLDSVHGGTIYGNSGTSSAELCPGFTANQEETQGNVKYRLSNYFNKNAFANSGGTCSFPVLGGNPSGAGTDYGNLRQHNARGPGQFNFDISLQKSTAFGLLGEHGQVQFRTEFFNAFNHPQFALPGTDISSAGTFGVISSTSVASRLIQFGLKLIF
jgi:hypothetical protein